MADNAGAMPGLAVDAARAHGCHAVDELGFAYRAHFDRSGGARHGARLHEHGGEDVVAAARIRQQFVEQIAPARPVPEMMMRIDDRQIGLEDRLLAPVEPIPADGKVTGRWGGW